MTLHAWDMSSFMWTHLAVGKDKEHGRLVMHEEKEVYVNSAIYGYDNCMNRMIELAQKKRFTPNQMILVFEGAMSKSQRLLISKDYKGGGGQSRPPEAYAEFEKLRDMLKETWKGVGAQTMWQDYAEGDDTLAWLAKHTEEHLVVYTFDNDLTVLNFTNAQGARVSTWINQMEAHNKYGAFDYHLVNTYKALIGDSSDKIKGCTGFGPAKWDKLLATYGEDGVQEIHDMLVASNLDPLQGMVHGDKLLQMIVDQAPQVIQSFDLARLRPEWVNTMRRPLNWEPGMVRQFQPGDDLRMKPWYGTVRLVTAENFDAAVNWAMPHILKSKEIALDIETSSAEESDEWLARKGNEEGVDAFGSTLTGMGLTFGDNNQHTLYFSVGHADTPNISSEALRQVIASIPRHIPFIVQNCSFEACVLFNEWGDRQMDNGYYGYLPNMLDTKIEANYVDENIPVGLKQRSHGFLGYRQETYDEVTKLTAPPSELPAGGKHVGYIYKTEKIGTGVFEPLCEAEIEAGLQPTEVMKTIDVLEPTGRMLTARCDVQTFKRIEYVYATDEEIEESDDLDPDDQIPEMQHVIEAETRRYKMNELPAHHVLGYGADDTICTIALHNYYKLVMQLEHTWQVYLDVEIPAIYANAAAFTSGIAFSMERMLECEKEDKEAEEKSWPVLRDYLIEKGWAGTTPPTYTVDITPAQVKEAFQIVTGRPLDTAMRTLSKLVTFIREVEGEVQFAGMLDTLVRAKDLMDDGRTGSEVIPAAEKAGKEFTSYVRKFFKGEPQFNEGSPKQMQSLLYEVMALPVRLRNKPTDIMRKAGLPGTAKTDDLAVQTALHYDADQTNTETLKAIQTLKQCSTRSKLFYQPYRNFPHWKDGLLHPSTNQCATVTRRNSASDPNYTQWPSKGEGIKFRECIVARGPKRVLISSDCSGQELRLAADWSRDPNMLSCYIGDNLRDIHSMVASAATKYFWDREWSYEEFYAALKGIDEELSAKVDALRSKSKAVTFGEIYGSMALSLSQRLMITEEEAQLFLDAKKAQFPLVDEWKDSVVASARQTGYSLTMLGARRHLAAVLTGSDKWKVSKAERQLSNFCIQSSGAEAIKLALGKCFFSEVMRRCDVHILGSIHDEILLDCPAEHAYEVATELVKFLEAQYANMIVPFVSETTIGTDFGKQLKLPLKFTPEDVQKQLNKLFKEAA